MSFFLSIHHVCVCVCVCIYIYIYTHLYTYTFIYPYVYLHTHTYTHKYVYKHIYIYIIYIYIYIYIYIFLYWSGHPVFSTSLATTHFHFVLDLTLLLYVDLNHLTILSSHQHEGLPIGHFRSLGYHSITAQIYLLSVNFVKCLVKRNFCF